jgi:DNA adenine methylase
MRKERSKLEIYNDVWDTVVNVFEVLRDRELAEKLETAIRFTPFARTEFEKCGQIYLDEVTDVVERARLTIFRSHAGFGSASTNAKHATGFRYKGLRAGTLPVHNWATYPDELRSFVERLQGVVIENKPYDLIIRQCDAPDVLIYMDPPYMHSTRNMQRGNASYAHEFTDECHVKMLEMIGSLKSMVVLSGYDCELYNDCLWDWYRVKKDTYGDGATKRTEVLWLNEAAYNNLL